MPRTSRSTKPRRIVLTEPYLHSRPQRLLFSNYRFMRLECGHVKPAHVHKVDNWKGTRDNCHVCGTFREIVEIEIY